MAGESTPRVGGARRLCPGEPAGAGLACSCMEHTPTKDDLTADLELLLRESDREDPILPELLDPRREPEEQIDSQILAGLVHP